MKKLIYTLAAVLVSVTAAAQDIIVTVEAQEIEAKIVEVGETQIKYKRLSNPDGPTYTMNIANIFYVKYANGDKDTFDEQKEAMARQSSVAVNRVAGAMGNSLADTPMAQYDGLIPHDFKGSAVLSEEGTLMSNEQVKAAFSVVDPDLYDRWRSALRLKNVGTSLTGLGMGFSVTGIILGIVGSTGDVDVEMATAGWSIVGACQLLIIPGIAMSCAGTGKQARVMRDFKEAAGIHIVSPSVRFGIVGQGVGMSLRF